VDSKTAISNSTLKLRARFRTAGVIVLLLGIGGACILYWIRTRSGDWTDDTLLEGYSKAELRQREIIYGRMGLMISDLTDYLKRPSTQAVCIAAVSALIALGCFFIARRLHDGDETG
jgi:hypothetical protein